MHVAIVLIMTCTFGRHLTDKNREMTTLKMRVFSTSKVRWGNSEYYTYNALLLQYKQLHCRYCTHTLFSNSNSTWGANATCGTSLANHVYLCREVWLARLICYMSGALWSSNEHIILYDITTWSWVNLVNPGHETMAVVTKFTWFGTVSSYVTLWNIYNPLHALLNIHNSLDAALVNTLDRTVC